MLAIVRDGSVEVKKQNTYVAVQDGNAIVFDDRWITINADEEEGRKGQHVLIKENGAIIYGLGGKFKYLRDLGKNKPLARDYNNNIAKTLGKQHYDSIRDKVENCNNEKFKKFWAINESKITVGDAHHKGRAYFSSLRGIYIDIDKDAQQSWSHPAYQTIMHESGHAIDKKSDAGWFSVKYKNGIFGQTIADEINGHIDHLTIQAKIDFQSHGNDARWLYDNGYLKYNEYWEYKNGIKTGAVKYEKKRVYQKLDNALAKLGPEGAFDFADMVEGVTKGKAGQGHGAKYWRDNEKMHGKYGGTAIESFAEMTSATATNPKSLAVIKRWLPKSYAIYEEMIEEITKREEAKKNGK